MTTLPAYAQDWVRGFAPPPDLTVSEWATACRRLPEASAARGARWRNEVAPYLIGVMDAVLERGVRQIAVVKAAQVGASESLTNVIGYFMENRPCPMLLVLPTASAATAYAKERLSDAIRTTPALRDVVTDKRVPSSEGLPESTLALKMFPGGFLALAGANSPNSFARWSVRIAIADDCDRIPRCVGLEGDPEKLLVNRTASFPDGLTVFASTPVLAGGRIETLFAASDRRRFHLPCDGCGASTWTTWNDRTRWRVAFDRRDASTARLEHSCGYSVPEAGRAQLVRRGEWRPTAEPAARGHVGFHISAMLSPFVTLASLAEKFLAADAAGTPRRLREFVTTALGEGWRDADKEAPEAAELIERTVDAYV